jgi:hypothetical protein
MMVYKIIRIIDEKSIMLNCGAKQGITVGDMFYIRSKSKEVITDPDTDEVLAEIQKYKAKIEVVSIYDKICICQNARTSPLLSEAMTSVLTIRRRLDLNVDPTQITGNFIMDEEELIQVGDEVEPVTQSRPAQLENPEGDQT